MTETQKRNARKKRARERDRVNPVASETEVSATEGFREWTLDVQFKTVFVRRCCNRGEDKPVFRLESERVLFDTSLCGEAKSVDAKCSNPLERQSAIVGFGFYESGRYFSFDFSDDGGVNGVRAIMEALVQIESLVKENYDSPYVVTLYDDEGKESAKWRGIGILGVGAADVVAAVC